MTLGKQHSVSRRRIYLKTFQRRILKVRDRLASKHPNKEFTDNSDKHMIAQFGSGKGEFSIHNKFRKKKLDN